jgi:hypothetical protein
MNKEIVMNPDILPTLEEWKLICKMVKQQQAEIEALKQRLELAEWDEEIWKKFKKDNYEVIELKPRSEK